jgi:broad specificity phosphatase PhoE
MSVKAGQAHQRITRPFPEGESYLQVVDRIASFLEEVARDWDQARVLVVGHSATRWALDYLLAGAVLHELVAAPFAWQEGWSYALPLGWRRPGLVAGQGIRRTSTGDRPPALQAAGTL